jgi:glycosyltransferase involved in cell wall biosynthesis
MILGCRGIPARHGGFETFAEDLSLYLTRHGHSVTVYCQADEHALLSIDEWNGVERIHIPSGSTPFSTVLFDWKAIRHSLGREGVILTLGYNTAVLNLAYRLKRRPFVMNMDGIEWKRQKWSGSQRLWLWANEVIGAASATHLVADHPEIRTHLERHTTPEKITMIPYGAECVNTASAEALWPFGLESRRYYVVIARPEPENSILQIVSAYTRRQRAWDLVILGRYLPDKSAYQAQVLARGNHHVHFPGAIYDKSIVRALRYHCAAYVHGHTVGGTNPSLVEALACGCAIVAQDNRFNRWVAGHGARYFEDEDGIASIFDQLEKQPHTLDVMRAAARRRHRQQFTQEKIMQAYEDMLLRVAGEATGVRQEILVASSHS